MLTRKAGRIASASRLPLRGMEIMCGFTPSCGGDDGCGNASSFRNGQSIHLAIHTGILSMAASLGRGMG